MLGHVSPDVFYVLNNVVVPAKAVTYKIDPATGHIIETVRPNTHKFENELKNNLRLRLKEENKFPTDQEVFVNIFYGVHSQIEYDAHDLDNRSKTILDALKSVIYNDDHQVSVLTANKEFLENFEKSSVKISVKKLDKDLKRRLMGELNEQ